MDLALAIQQVTEDIVLRLARTARTATGCRHLVLAGGVALNCVANGKVLTSRHFRRPVDSAGGGRRRRSGRRRLCRVAHPSRPAAGIGRRTRHLRRDDGQLPRAAVLGSRHRADHSRVRAHGRRTRPTWVRWRPTSPAAGGRPGGRLVPGAHGVRAAGARQPQHPRRPAQSRDAEAAQPEGEVPRGVPAVRAVGARGRRRRALRARSAVALYAARRARARRTAARLSAGAPARRRSTTASTSSGRICRRSPTWTTRRASRR